MLVDFFLHLKSNRLPVSTKEFLTLLDALGKGVISHSLDDFYILARTTLIKDEANFDKYDRAFGEYFHGIEKLPGMETLIPEEWLRQSMKRHLTPEEQAKLEKLGWDKLMETFKERLAEQKGRHAGGSKWIGTGGTSPFGHGGTHPEGIRVGGKSENRSAVKVWEKREFRNLDDTVELGTRNIKVALRRLRRFAREGAAEELDLDGTIAGTAKNAGWLDLHLRPERHNAVKVLLFLDVGGSMDDHIRVCEELFSACRSEFKHLEHYYFHNCVYEGVWKDNARRHNERVPTHDVLHRYGNDYKLIFVGDASMSPYELLHPGGGIEHWNEEPGAVWLGRLFEAFPHAIWLNPEPEHYWQYRQSIALVRNLIGSRMYPLTLEGLANGMRQLNK
ncbi:MAG: uncharacterized protein QG616_1969 [Pseudomonadota bacterium]|nr:uncharacterized protein [Pseudomonadota bacterium]